MAYKNICALILGCSFVNFRYTKYAKKKYVFLNSGASLAIEQIANFYKKIEIPIFLVIDNQNKNFKFKAFSNCNFIKVSRTNSIFETLKIALSEIEKLNFNNIIINPIQVIPTENLKNDSISLSKSSLRKGRWTAIDFDSEEIKFLYRDDSSAEGKLAYPFTGRINVQISHLKLFFSLTMDSKFNDLGYLASFLFEKFKYKFQYELWLDLTHEALFTETKLKNIISREFHNIKYNKEKNSITKEIKDQVKLNEIIHFYKKLKNNLNLQRFFPILLEKDSPKNKASYTLEYIPFPSLSELFLHENLEYHIWEKIILKLKNIYDEIYPDSSGIEGLNSKEFFSNKLQKRNQLLIKLLSSNKYPVLEKIYLESYKVNSISMPPLKDSFHYIQNLLRQFDTKSRLWFGHGDLCFNNILIDPFSLTTKLIDPKAFSSLGNKYIGFVPRNYDLAKLNHSFIGLYDSIISNMYSLQIMEDNNINLKIFHPQKHHFIKKVFSEVFFENKKMLMHDINIITASLFLSMLPLHSEDSNRMVVLAILGNAILESSEKFSSEIFI